MEHQSSVPPFPDVPTTHSYLFPSLDTSWNGPDPLFRRSRILNSLRHTFNLENILEHHQAGFEKYWAENVYQFLAYEAINAHSAKSPSQDMDAMGVLSFARLHHLNLHGFEFQLESELNQLCETSTTDHQQLTRLRSLLRDYCQAIRDYQFITEHSFKPPHPKKLYPFHETLLPTLLSRLKRDEEDPIYKSSWQDNTYHGIATPYMQWADNFMSKLWGAAFGGLMLIIPMIIMTYHPNLSKSLIISSLFIAAVALAIVRLSEGTWRDALGMTAAYAAVLVVFVGSSTGGLTRNS